MADNYTRKYRWKLWLIAVAAVIVGGSLWYTSLLAKRIASEEKQKVRIWAEATQNKARLLRITTQLFDRLRREEKNKVILWANATRRLIESDEIDYFAFAVVQDNETVPVILTDDKAHIIASRNVDNEWLNDADTLTEKLKNQFTQYEPIEVESKGWKNEIYYRDSRLFTDLRSTLDELINSFISEIVINSASVPVIFTDKNKKVLSWGNIDSVKVKQKGYLEKMLSSMESENKPIEIDLGDGNVNYAYYRNSYLLKQVRFYPIVQFAIIGLFLLIAYYAFSTSRKIEQNQVWVGMAKETAHQLGTPISSLAGWMEIMKDHQVNEEWVNEMEKDMLRLEVITDRFSKIGSAPILEKQNVSLLIKESIAYFSKRISNHIELSLHLPDGDQLWAMVSPPLFMWVLENLIKNSLDAMSAKGSISVEAGIKGNAIYIDVQDTGKGISKSKFKTIFQPGFSTKKRGWGLGLSLTKRIIREYHSGKIFVQSSSPGKGATIRILLPKSKQKTI